MPKNILSASILAADFANLGQECAGIISAGADMIHFDVMDHHFVPNLSFGPFVCQALRKAGVKAPIDVHLMVEEPEKYIEAFAKYGANLIIFHPQTAKNSENLVDKIHAHDMRAGLAYNPDTPLEISPELIAQLDLLMIMGVQPGFAGQAFLPQSLDKIKQAKKLLDQYNPACYLAVDGGVKSDNIQTMAQAGANFFVLGSGLFSANDYQTQVKTLRQLID